MHPVIRFGRDLCIVTAGAALGATIAIMATEGDPRRRAIMRAQAELNYNASEQCQVMASHWRLAGRNHQGRNSDWNDSCTVVATSYDSMGHAYYRAFQALQEYLKDV